MLSATRRNKTMNTNETAPPGSLHPVVRRQTCQFLVAFKECGKPATHFRQVTTISTMKGTPHEFTADPEYYCAHHYGYAEKWCNHSGPFRYRMGELSPNDRTEP
jgi:hypothetical protein